MKKLNIISFIAVIVSLIGLALLRLTGMPAHIVISVIALAVMVICAIADRKNWKNPALEIVYRAFYLITLITGIVMVAAAISSAIGIVHKIAAAAFAVLFIVNFFLPKKK